MKLRRVRPLVRDAGPPVASSIRSIGAEAHTGDVWIQKGSRNARFSNEFRRNPGYTYINRCYAYAAARKQLVVGRPLDNIVTLYPMDEVFAEGFGP